MMKQETNRSAKKAWNPIVVLALVLCAVFGLTAITYSWLTQSKTAVPTGDASNVFVSQMEIDDFSYVLQYSFDGENWQNAHTANDANGGLGGVVVDPSNVSNVNPIRDLHFQLRQTGTVKSAVRVKFSYQWVKTENLQEKTVQGPALSLTPDFANPSPWRYNMDDGFYYYVDSTASYVFPRNQDISLVTGFTLGSTPNDTGAKLKIIAFVDGVQFNRYREVWELTSAQSNG